MQLVNSCNRAPEILSTVNTKGLVSSPEVGTAVENVRAELSSNGDGVGVGVALRAQADEVADRPPVEVDCAARMHLCHAVCCRLDFALSQSEVESGNIKWDLGRPYFIRHEANGRCAHLLNQETGGCNVYANRPAVCRGYSCANDKRIWKDFEKMEINDEWISQNLSPTRPRALKILMNRPVYAQPAGGAENANEGNQTEVTEK